MRRRKRGLPETDLLFTASASALATTDLPMHAIKLSWHASAFWHSLGKGSAGLAAPCDREIGARVRAASGDVTPAASVASLSAHAPCRTRPVGSLQNP